MDQVNARDDLGGCASPISVDPKKLMHNMAFNPQPASRLMLGTVQFGMPYGVANRTGQPGYNEVKAIVAAALDGGVNCFDTAAAYGSSEEVLGRVLRELGALDKVLVVTKVRHLEARERADHALAARAVEQSVEASLRRLGLDRLPIVLFHNEYDAVHADILTSLHERGWIERAGFSSAKPPTAPLEIDPRYTAVQIPGNLLDRWPRNPAIVGSLDRPGLDVFLRSVYLQGLLIMPPEAVPPHLAEVLPVRQRLAAIAGEAGMTEAELALRYALTPEIATRVLIGVETPEQLRANVRIAERGPLAPEVMAKISDAVADVNDRLLAPSGWSDMERAWKASHP